MSLLTKVKIFTTIPSSFSKKIHIRVGIMKEALKEELVKYAKFNHQQWGWVLGTIGGFTLGVELLIKYGLQEIDMPIIGKIDHLPLVYRLFMEASLIPLTAGTFANLFSHFGSGIDLITNKNTLLSWVYKKKFEQSNAPVSLREAEFFTSIDGENKTTDQVNEDDLESGISKKGYQQGYTKIN